MQHSSGGTKGAAVLAGLILAAALTVAGTVPVLLPHHQPTQVNNKALAASVAVITRPTPGILPETGSTQTKEDCYAGTILTKQVSSHNSRADAENISCYTYGVLKKSDYSNSVTGDLYTQLGYVTGCLSLQDYTYITQHPDGYTTLRNQTLKDGKCVPSNGQTTIKNSTFGYPTVKSLSSACKEARPDACIIKTCMTPPAPSGSSRVMPPECTSVTCDAQQASKNGCTNPAMISGSSNTIPTTEQVKQCSLATTYTDSCAQILNQCVNNPASCGGVGNAQIAMCGLYPSSPGCEDYAKVLTPCQSGDQRCIKDTTATQDQINCLAQGSSNCFGGPSVPDYSSGCPSGFYPSSAGTYCVGFNKQTGKVSVCTPGNCDPAAGGGTAPFSGCGPGYYLASSNPIDCEALSCPTGTMGTYPNCQPLRNGGLNQNPYQQFHQQQPMVNQPGCQIGNLVGSMITGNSGYAQQSYQCAQNAAQYNQLMQQAQYNYTNQLNQYNHCRQQALYAQQSGQCPQQCWVPQQPQIQMCSNAQSSSYGVGSDGQPCSQPPQQPDPSQCNGMWRPTSGSGNGCTTGWQCVPNSCQATPQQPDPSTCTSGVWQPLYAQPGNTNSCIVNWQCSTQSTSGLQASLSCVGPNSSAVVAPGDALTIGWTCQGASGSSGQGFGTSNLLSGTTTITQAAPPSGTNTATYRLSCTNASTASSVGAQCSVNVVNPKIVLAAVLSTVHSGDTATIGWVTSGMRACTISSPDLPDFTTTNTSNAAINGVVTTPHLNSTARFVASCTTLTGARDAATTTVAVQ